MNIQEFKDKIDIDFLNKHIHEMLEYNIPFPIELVFNIKDENIQRSVHDVYFLKAKKYKTWYNAMKQVDMENQDYFEYSYKKLVEYVNTVPKFRGLLK